MLRSSILARVAPRAPRVSTTPRRALSSGAGGGQGEGVHVREGMGGGGDAPTPPPGRPHFPLPPDPKAKAGGLTPLVVGACFCLAALQARHLWQERER